MITKRFASCMCALLILLSFIVVGSTPPPKRRPLSPILPGPTPSPVATPTPEEDPRRRTQSAIDNESVKSIHTKCFLSDADTVDLSGTFEGYVVFPEKNLEGNAILEIKDCEFSLTVGMEKVRGRVIIHQSGGETSVALSFSAGVSGAGWFPELTPSSGLSLRAQKCGRGLKLKAVDEESSSFVFTQASAQGAPCKPFCPRKPCPRFTRNGEMIR